jgi:hypothetical protein
VGPAELVFIDASHAYESVKGDFLSWAPKIAMGGTLAFHDVSEESEGVVRLVTKYVLRGENFADPRKVMNIMYVRRVRGLSPVQSIQNTPVRTLPPP